MTLSTSVLLSQRHFDVMADADCREVAAAKASPTAKPALSSAELDRFPSQSPPTYSKRPFGLRPSPGPGPATTSSVFTNNLWSFPKTASFSSTASRLKSFSKYRTRRLSDDSLTDLSPPTHSDLDCISPSRNLSLDQIDQEPPSPARSHRNSAIFLGTFKPSSLSNKPPRENHSANMNLFKGTGTQASFSSRLRLLSKNSSEKQAPEKSKPSSRNQTEHSASRSLKPAGPQSFQNNAARSELELNNTTGSDEIEAIQSPPCDLRIVANQKYPPRSCSIVEQPDSPHQLNRSSSSPNLNFPTTFSQRTSSESVRHGDSVSVTASPKRHAPPPIKVPKLRASSIAIAIGSDMSPVGACSRSNSRHGHSRSDGGSSFVRRIAALEWPGHARKPSAQEPHLDASEQPVSEAPLHQTILNTVQEDSSVGTSDAISASSTPRNGVISISNSSKVIKDKVPDVLPLQPAPRRLSGYVSHSNTDSKGPTMPLFISKHSRTVGNAACVAPQNRLRSSISSDSSTRESDSQSSAGQVSLLPCTATHSQYPETPHQTYAGFRLNPSWTIQETTEKPEASHARHNFSPGSIPFPTSQWPSQLTPSLSEEDLPTSSCNDGVDNQCQLSPSPQAKSQVRFPGRKEKHRTKSFDIRNFPLHLDTSQRSDSLPSIAIPQPIQIPQFVSGSLPSLPVSGVEHNPVETFGKPSLSGTIRRYESSDLSSLRSVVSNGSSAEAHRSMNRIFTPTSTPLSDRSSGFASAEASHKVATPTYHSALDSSCRSLSVDDFYLNINSNVLLDLTRRDGKVSRPRSMSDRGPNRYEIGAKLSGLSKDSIHSQKSSPYIADHPLPLLTLAQSPRSPRWITASIAQKIRESTTSELDKLVTEALKTYHPDSHRFVTGEIKDLIREGRQSEQKAEDLQKRYLVDLQAREKLLHRHVMTLRALNGDKGVCIGESVLKVVMDTDQHTSELLRLIDHSSKIDRMCEAHWRAAATVQMNNLAMKEAQLEAAQSRIEQLESDRVRHLKLISDLQVKIDATQDQARPSSRATDADSIGPGPFPRVRMNSKNTHELVREGFTPDSPSSTPRISHFPYHCPQQLPHTNLYKSRVRFNSVHSFTSSHSSHSPCENSFGEGGCFPAALPEPVSPRTAFLSPYGLAHNQAGSHERSESLPVSRNESGPLSPRKTHLSNASLSALPNAVTTFHRSDSIGSRKKAQVTGLISRNILAANNTIKQRGSINGNHFKSSRSSSLNSSDLKIEIVDSNVSGSHDAKPRSTSNTFIPYLKNGTNASATEATTPIDGSNEFQQTNTASRGPSSSSLTRFPRQAAPAPKLPLPYESNSRRRGQWSPSSSAPGNLSSITLSQLGSIDIANLLSNIESSSQ